MRRRAPAGRHTVSYSRPHLIRIPIPSPSSFNAPPGVIWTFDRNDGDAPVELQTHSCIAMIEAPWTARARCLAAQCATAVRTLYALVTHPHSIACFFQGLFSVGPFQMLDKVLSGFV